MQTTELPPTPPLGKELSNDFPVQYTLEQNYPNPFNPVTTIGFELPYDSHVYIRVYNVLGQEITTLLNEEQKAGKHFVSWDASGAPSGIYYYSMYAVSSVEGTEKESFMSIKSLLLVR